MGAFFLPENNFLIFIILEIFDKIDLQHKGEFSIQMEKEFRFSYVTGVCS